MSQQTYHQVVSGLPIGKFISLVKVPNGGSVEARKMDVQTTRLYWRWTHDKKAERVPIGMFDSGAPVKKLQPGAKGYSIAAAMEVARGFAKIHRENLAIGGYAGVLAMQVAEESAAGAKAEAAKRDALQYTLRNLLEAYCEHQKKMERSSHADARSIFENHVFKAWPEVAAMAARDVTTEQAADIMRCVVEKGHPRTANKLRSYAAAAFQLAKAAKSKPSIPIAFKAYGATVNPFAETLPDESANRDDKNPLSTEEMRAYWATVKPLEGIKGAILRLHLLTGAQRLEQLVRLKSTDVSDAAMVLYDQKGRPGKAARKHLVPLTKPAAAAMRAFKASGVFALSTDGGATHIAAETLSRWAADVAAHMPDSIRIKGFQAKRLRSGVETMLASLKVSPGDRGELQSHGLSGIQKRHYDSYSYLDEKTRALEKLYRALDAPPDSNVTQLRRRN